MGVSITLGVLWSTAVGKSKKIIKIKIKIYANIFFVVERKSENKKNPRKMKAHRETAKWQQFQEEYILMGFTSTCSDSHLALCFFCGEAVANSCMKHRPMLLSICTLLMFMFTLPNGPHSAYTLFMFILFYFIPKMFCAGDRGTHLKKYLRGGGLGSFRTTALVYNTVRCRTGLSQSEAVPRLCVDRLSPVLTTELRKYWQRHRLVVPHKQRCYSNTQIASVATVTHTLTPGCLTVTHRTS